MKVAYQQVASGGYDSSKEPFGGSPANGYCHAEPLQNYPAASNYAEKLTLPSGVVVGTTLYFVNPWVTYVSGYGGVLGTAINDTNSGYKTPTTQMYIYVNIINTRQTAYTPTAGSIDLGWYSANHLDGTLLGVYYKGTFYAAANAPSITSGTSYYAIYKMNMDTMKLTNPPSSSNGAMPSGSVMLWGDASVTNGAGNNNENQGYLSATVLLAGLWVRYETSSTSC
jgi:hypothetical protein